jgi:hypothetical protein
MTIFLIIVVAVVGALWFYTKRSAAKEQTIQDEADVVYQNPISEENHDLPTQEGNPTSGNPTSGTPHSGGASIFTQEVTSPDTDKPFANLKSNTAGKVAEAVAEAVVEAEAEATITEKPKRKKRKSPAKSTPTEGEALPAKPKRKYTKRKTDN